MNCKQCQEQIRKTLAAGSELPTAEVFAHQSSCPLCSEFYDAQLNLFQAVDAGLRSLVNHPVPPSLLPGVCARMDEKNLPQRDWIPGWGYAAVAAAAILAVSVVFALRRQVSPPSLQGNTTVASRSVANRHPATQPPRKPGGVAPTTRVKPVVAAVSSAAAPEVIVLAEERQAFAEFVAEVPERREVALALTQPAQAATDAPVEIAFLQIKEVEVKPLEGTPRE
jgi:hypothetical protein